jgi:transposase-like protein
LRKAEKTMSNYPPESITTDKLASYSKTIRRLQPEEVMHRASKYLNNIIEADHRALKRVIRPTRGFQSMKAARATIKGIEVMRMIRRGYCILRGPLCRIQVATIDSSGQGWRSFQYCVPVPLNLEQRQF